MTKNSVDAFDDEMSVLNMSLPLSEQIKEINQSEE